MMYKPDKHLEVTVPVPWSSEPVRFTFHTPLGLLVCAILLSAGFVAWYVMRGP